MPFEYPDEARKQAIASIKRYFDEVLDDDIGDLKAEMMLDFILKEISPTVYNQAIQDAQKLMQERVTEMDGSLFATEFAYFDKSTKAEMKILLFGSTGMVGQGVLRECLADPDVSEVISVVRKSTGRQHGKLRETVHADFTNFSTIRFDADACFWCLGVSSNGMTEIDYTRVTHDYTLAAAKVMNARMTFIFVSGQGADRDVMWARVKKRTEDDLASLPFKAVYVFRPGFIQPLDGIRSRTKFYNILYPMLYPVMLAMKALSPRNITDTRRIGRAMLNIAKRGYPVKILENPDINTAALP